MIDPIPGAFAPWLGSLGARWGSALPIDDLAGGIFTSAAAAGDGQVTLDFIQ